MPVSDNDKVRLDLYWKTHVEQATQARQQTTLRATVCATVLLAATIVISLHVELFKPGAGGSRIVAAMLVMLGLLGMLVSFKHYERSRMHNRVADRFAAAIDGILLKSDIGDPETLRSIGGQARRAHEQGWTFRYFSKYVHLHVLWLVVFALMVAAGVAVWPA